MLLEGLSVESEPTNDTWMGNFLVQTSIDGLDYKDVTGSVRHFIYVRSTCSLKANGPVSDHFEKGRRTELEVHEIERYVTGYEIIANCNNFPHLRYI